MFQKLFSLFTSSKRRKSKGTKRGNASGKSFGKRSTKTRRRRVSKMRGGWGEPMSNLPQMFQKEGIMKGGWGGPVTPM